MTVSPTTATSALYRERAALIELCEGLDLAQWRTPSRAAGWQVRDVVAHMGATSKDAFGPRLAQLVTGNRLERANDDAVQRRRHHSPAEVFAEYRLWSGRFAQIFGAAARTPARHAPLRLADLGWYPMGILPAVMTFDHYVHLRLDIAPALGITVPAAEPETLSTVLEWMITGVPQMHTRSLGWLDRPVALVLTGDGGGQWTFAPGRHHIQVAAGVSQPAITITGRAIDFPSWATTRTSWEDADLSIAGDDAAATRFLRAINIV